MLGPKVSGTWGILLFELRVDEGRLKVRRGWKDLVDRRTMISGLLVLLERTMLRLKEDCLSLSLARIFKKY